MQNRISDSGLSGTLWPAHPKPQHDELLSSWLVRLAMAHGIKLHTFCTVAWPGKQIWNRDIDKCADRTILDTLSKKTAVPLDLAGHTTLATYQGLLYEHHNALGNTFWIMPLGVYHRRHRQFGLQFCPGCLAEDKTPYYRRRWRLAFITCCESHGLMLLDRCTNCEAPINFHRAEMGNRKSYFPKSMTCCYQCKMDLRETSSAMAPPTIIEYQTELVNTIQRGWTEIPYQGPIYSHLYFSVLHQLMKILSMGPRSKILREALSRDYGLKNPPLNLAKEHRAIESLNVQSRVTLLCMAKCLLEKWPYRFIRICVANRIWSSTLLKDFRSPPFWYWSVIHDYLFRTSYQPSELEITSIIAYLKKNGVTPNRKLVSRYLGVNDTFRKRKTHKFDDVL